MLRTRAEDIASKIYRYDQLLIESALSIIPSVSLSSSIRMTNGAIGNPCSPRPKPKAIGCDVYCPACIVVEDVDP